MLHHIHTSITIQENKLGGYFVFELLRRIWRVWKKIGQLLSDFIARLFLTLFYFTIFVPFGIGVRMLSDPLNLRKQKMHSWWLEHGSRECTLQDSSRQG